MDLTKRYIKWRLKGMIVAEKRLKSLLSADVRQEASDQQLDGLFIQISTELKALTSMQSEIMTLQEIRDEKDN
jgi:hypothetical protein